jgi:large subunit ribosomal protein L4
MKCPVTTLESKDSGTIDLDETIFGLPARKDLLARVVNWQLAKRRAGTHQVKNRTAVTASSRKIVRQKGSGGARHGAKDVSQFRGGGRAFGPLVRDHGYQLPKKVRRLALKTALSSKLADGKLVVLDALSLKEAKTGALAKKIGQFGWRSALIIDGAEVDGNFARAARNLRDIDVLPQQGANVYDILRRDTLVLTKAAVEALEARLK